MTPDPARERATLRRDLLAACEEALRRSQRGYDTAEVAVAFLRRQIVRLMPERPGEPHGHPSGFACLRCATRRVVRR